ncbi:pyrimidine dimer DNA glycosylase/endonuclease V [Marinobacter sp. BGYM27]|uniref:pyrimidine dimer DNA glycosylase/endonuclease V n=1 Tax=Marinobacter sp. BGYM27 TaxID=2975597 RepID=UPI0021A552A5|nr:pyrimidine dimer DNA glycosylase/endonuclease V [Marinobacter sp. BGYM27]MDG5500967.1 pyrimidine dimer DNA glycosylase/endonuclease V [Marinobacter sp. BGYM27]
MNIFVLDDDITKCAEYHCDQHAIKMILESVQLLCTALNKKGFSTPYKSTHAKHPCVLWVEASYDNFEWLVQLTLALNAEYRFRFDKTGDHKSIAVLSEIDKFRFERLGLTPFAQAMPDQYKQVGDPVSAYRQFYLGEKMGFAKWTKREVPLWISQHVEGGA